MKRKLKKLSAVTVMMILAVSLFAGMALADGNAQGTVNVGTYLNVRQSNTTASVIVGKLSSGAKVTVLSSSAGWYRISSGAVTGWVSGHYLTVDAAVDVTNYLNIRSAGSTAAAITGELYNDTLVTIIDSSSDGWSEVAYYGGTGWVSSQYLKLGNAYISSNPKIQTVTDTAQRMIGVPYVFAGASTSGFDCSGLTLYAYSKIGVTLPHSAAQQATLGTAVSRANPQPGDLVFFDTDGGNNNITHVGIYIGNNMFVNAESGTMQRVNECSLSNSYWSGAYMTARRLQ